MFYPLNKISIQIFYQHINKHLKKQDTGYPSYPYKSYTMSNVNILTRHETDVHNEPCNKKTEINLQEYPAVNKQP